MSVSCQIKKGHKALREGRCYVRAVKVNLKKGHQLVRKIHSARRDKKEVVKRSPRNRKALLAMYETGIIGKPFKMAIGPCMRVSDVERLAARRLYGYVQELKLREAALRVREQTISRRESKIKRHVTYVKKQEIIAGIKVPKMKKPTNRGRRDHGSRFMKMCKAFDCVEKNSFFKVKKYLSEFLAHVSRDSIGESMSFPKCNKEAKVLRFGKGYRTTYYRSLGKDLLGILYVFGKKNEFQQKMGWVKEMPRLIPLTWIVCYLNGIFPDTSRNGWENFQCSHLCTNGACLMSDHLTWESSQENISRGHSVKVCRTPCKHKCKHMNTCECKRIHKPACI